jgi:hypothetical protein
MQKPQHPASGHTGPAAFDTNFDTSSNSKPRFVERFTLRENRLLFHFVPRTFELETV